LQVAADPSPKKLTLLKVDVQVRPRLLTFGDDDAIVVVVVAPAAVTS
jgi:hypothetical protein